MFRVRIGAITNRVRSRKGSQSGSARGNKSTPVSPLTSPREAVPMENVLGSKDPKEQHEYASIPVSELARCEVPDSKWCPHDVSKFAQLTTFQRYRGLILAFVDSEYVQNVVVALIVLSALILGIQTSDKIMESIGGPVSAIMTGILIIFILEIGGRWFGMGWSFFKDAWNWFDVVIITIALLPDSSFGVLRVFRILRVLRMIRKLKRMKMIIESLISSLPSISWISALMIVLIYIFSVMGVELFGEKYPDEFGSIPVTMWTCFQLMTLEGWPDLARPMVQDDWTSAIYFLCFILIASFVMMNVFVAILVDTMQGLHKESDEDDDKEKVFRNTDYNEMMEKINELRGTLRKVGLILEAVGSEGNYGDAVKSKEGNTIAQEQATQPSTKNSQLPILVPTLPAEEERKRLEPTPPPVESQGSRNPLLTGGMFSQGRRPALPAVGQNVEENT